MGTLLETLIPRVAPSLTHSIHEHRNKTDLLAKLPRRLRGYARWIPSDYRVLVVVDRDRDDCVRLKQQLDAAAADAGLATSAATRGTQPFVVSRIAIQELEAWYFGDWAAVRRAYPRVPADVPRQARYRDPDSIGDTWEALETILQDAGYFSGGLRKVELARTLAPQLVPDDNTSSSFGALVRALRTMAA